MGSLPPPATAIRTRRAALRPHQRGGQEFKFLSTAAPPRPGTRYEFLNFALADCGPVAKLATLERGLQFEPDAVLDVAVSELFWMTKELVLSAHDGRPLPDSRLADALAELGVDSSTARAEAVPLIAFLPLPRDQSAEREAALRTERRLATEAGFLTVEIYDAFDGIPLQSLWVRTLGQPHQRCRAEVARRPNRGGIAAGTRKGRSEMGC